MYQLFETLSLNYCIIIIIRLHGTDCEVSALHEVMFNGPPPSSCDFSSPQCGTSGVPAEKPPEILQIFGPDFFCSLFFLHTEIADVFFLVNGKKLCLFFGRKVILHNRKSLKVREFPKKNHLLQKKSGLKNFLVLCNDSIISYAEITKKVAFHFQLTFFRGKNVSLGGRLPPLFPMKWGYNQSLFLAKGPQLSLTVLMPEIKPSTGKPSTFCWNLVYNINV